MLPNKAIFYFIDFVNLFNNLIILLYIKVRENEINL